MSLEDFNEELNQFTEEEEGFPQYLCKMCGRCCRAITTGMSYEELQRAAEEGEEEAKVFIEIFKRYPSIEEAKKVVPEHVDQVIETIRYKPDFSLEKLSFYYCPHITEENKCGIYEIRPACCRRAPRHGWSLMPPGCGFEGWRFEQREKQKKLIRSVKEYLNMYENIAQDGVIPGKNITIEELRKIVEEKIKPWERFGSMFW